MNHTTESRIADLEQRLAAATECLDRSYTAHAMTLEALSDARQHIIAAGIAAHQSGVGQWDAFAKTYLPTRGRQIVRAVSEYATAGQIRRAMMRSVDAF